MPAISYIMPVRNAEKWIEDTLRSVCDQHMPDWELIAVLDDSSDSSERILLDWQEMDERIKVAKNPDKGIIPALQLALKISTGEYISRIDADDLMPPDRSSLMLDHVHKTELPFVLTGYVQYFSDHEISPGYQAYEAWINERTKYCDHSIHLYRECVIASPNWLCRRDDLINHSILEDLSYPEDYHMVFKWHEAGFQFIGIPELTLHWREHPERTSRNSDHYQQKAFFRLKLQHWIKNEWNEGESVAIIGKGQKARWCEHFLERSGVPIRLYDQQTNLELDPSKESKLLIAVYPELEERLSIISFLEGRNYYLGKNAWFV